MTWLSFSIVATAFAYTAVGGARDWLRFTATDSADTRRYYYGKWVLDTWLALGLGAVVAAWALGELDLLLTPLPYAGLHLDPPDALPQDSGTAAGFAVGLGLGLAAAVAVLVVRLRRIARKTGSTGTATNALIPRSRQERVLAIHLCVAAGVAEELFFRAAVPVLVFTTTNNVNLAFATSILLFGLYHYYQGVKGVMATAFIGFVLMRLFVSSGTILAPMGLHVLIDLWALVVLPVILKARRRKNAEDHARERP